MIQLPKWDLMAHHLDHHRHGDRACLMVAHSDLALVMKMRVRPFSGAFTGGPVLGILRDSRGTSHRGVRRAMSLASRRYPAEWGRELSTEGSEA